MRQILLAASALAAVALGSQAASAAPAISIYYYFGNNTQTTPVPTDTTQLTALPSDGKISYTYTNSGTTYTENFAVSTGGSTPSQPPSNFGSLVFSENSSGTAGASVALTLVAYESGLTTPETQLTAGYTNNPGSTVNVVGAVGVVDSANATLNSSSVPFAFVSQSPTLMGGMNGQTYSETVGLPALPSTYGLIEAYSSVYTITSTVPQPQLLATTTVSFPSTTAVPEPASLALLGVGMVGFGLVRRRRNKTVAA